MAPQDTADFPDAERCARRVLTLELADERATRPERAASAPPPVDHGALWRRLHRAPADPIDLATERALATHASWRAAYRSMLGTVALASSPVAAAASGGTGVHRRIGDYALRVDEATDAGPHIVSILIPQGVPVPHVLEILSDEGFAIRLDLGAPFGDTILLVLFPDNPTHAAVHAALRSPLSGLYLISGTTRNS